MKSIQPSFYRPQRSWGKVIFSEACVNNSVHRGGVHGCSGGGVHGCTRGGMHGFIRGCMVLFGGHAWFYSGGVWFYLGGHAWFYLGGHAWFYSGGHVWFYSGGGFIRGGVHGFIQQRGACMVLFSRGACVVLFSRGACMVLFSRGACMVLFSRGGPHGFFSFSGYDEIRSMSGRYASYWNAFLFMTYFYRAQPDPLLGNIHVFLKYTKLAMLACLYCLNLKIRWIEYSVTSLIIQNTMTKVYFL